MSRSKAIARELRRIRSMRSEFEKSQAVVERELSKPVYPQSVSWAPHSEPARRTRWHTPMPNHLHDEGRFGWNSTQEFLKAVKQAAIEPTSTDSRLTEGYMRKRLDGYHKKAAAGGLGINESIGAEGGFLLAPTFVNNILEIVHEEGELLDKCQTYPITGPSIKIPAVDETSRTDGNRAGGVRGYWVAEGATITASQPAFQQLEFTPHKVACLVYVSEEMLEDGGNIVEQMVSRLCGKELRFMVEEAIFRGTGVGKPQGILNANAKVTVSAETGQAASTIVFENIVNMWSRLHKSARGNAEWYIHQDAEPQLYNLSLDVGTGGLPAYMPPGGLSAKPYATLMGRPVNCIEHASTLGTAGDIVLADMEQYIAIHRDPIKTAMSIHVQFLTEQSAFRFTWRVDGRSWWTSALTPAQGSNTQSPFVELATRA